VRGVPEALPFVVVSSHYVREPTFFKHVSRRPLDARSSPTQAAAMFNCATMLVGKATKTKRSFNICPSLAAFKFTGAGKR
jgi:hypothetical protein